MDGDEDCNIRVICRFRPVNKREIAEGGGLAKQLTFPTDKCVEVAPFNGRGAQTFNFDKIFYDPDTTQEDIYELAARKSIEDVIKGYNSTIFAYGQTGAGKSFTMFGPDIIVPDLKGIIPRSCMHIFQHIASDTEGTEYTIKCSFLEIYKENVRDLLNPSSDRQGGLRVREAPGKGVWVEGLHEEYVTCEDDVLELLRSGERHRSVSATQMNASSSRSHSLFILSLHQKTRDGSTKEGRLNLADLAGSEKVGKTGATGETLEEAKKINQSLSALGNCINALTKSKKAHVPYRDSKLTFILRESLGGNCKTTLLIACSPHVFNLEETISTLQFGKRAKTIKNSVKVNKQRSVAELMAIIEKLKKEMIFFKKYISILESELEKIKGPNWKDDLPKISRPSSKSTQEKPAESTTNQDQDQDQPEEDSDLQSDTGAGAGAGSSTPARVSQSTPSLTKSQSGMVHSQQQQQQSTPSTPTQQSTGAQRRATTATPSAGRGHHRRNSSVSSVASSGGDDDLSDGPFEEDGLLYSSSANMSIRLAELQVELQNLQEKSRLDITDLTEEKKSLQADLQEARAKIQAKKSLLQERESAMKDLKDDFEAQLQAKLAAEQKLIFEIKQLSLKTEEQQQSLQVLQTHLNEFKLKSQSLSDQMEDLHTEKDRLLQDRERFRRELEDSIQASQFKDSKISELEASLQEIEAERHSIRQQTLQLELHQANLSSKLDVQAQKNESLASQIRELDQKLRLSQSEKSLLESQLSQAREEISTLENDLDETRSQKDALRNQGTEQLEELRTSTVPMAQFERLQKDREKTKANLLLANQQLKEEREAGLLLKNELETLMGSLADEREKFVSDSNEIREEFQQKLHLLDAQLTDEKAQWAKRVKAQEEKSALLQQQLETEKSSRLRAEESLSEQSELLSSKEKLLRRANTSLEDKDRELDQLKSQLQSQLKSIEAQQERIKRLEVEQEESAKEKELLQQEVKTALEINIENSKQFQHQLDVAREETQRRPQNIRVPVPNERAGFFSSIFGGKQLPVLGEIKSPAKFGFLLKRSNWLKVWEKRWFVLTQNSLYYFDSNNQASKAMGEIEVEGCKIVPATEFTGRPNSFGIVHRSRKEFYLQAPSEEELHDWVRNLKATVNGQLLKQKRPAGAPRATQSLANVST